MDAVARDDGTITIPMALTEPGGTTIKTEDDDQTEAPTTILPEPGPVQHGEQTSSSSSSRLVETLGRQVMQLESEKYNLQSDVRVKAQVVEQLASRVVQESHEKEAAQYAWQQERALRIQALQMVPPEDPMVAKGGKKFARPTTIEEFKERKKRDLKNEKNTRRKLRREEEKNPK